MKKEKSSSLILERWDGTPEGKTRFHKDGKEVLVAVASELGLKKEQYDVASNEAGPAIAGTIYLWTDTFHLWINGGGSREWRPEDEGYVIARRVKDRKDHASQERNVEIAWELLWNPAALVDVLRIEGVAAS